jgi:AraC-like DNA-binding protein
MAAFSAHANDRDDVALIPHPAATVLIDLGGEAFAVTDGAGICARERVVAGIGADGLRGRGLPARSECLQVRLSPPVACALLGPDPVIGALTLDDLWGNDALVLQERLRVAGSWQQRFTIVGALLTERLAVARAPEPELAFVWRRLMASRGRVNVERLADEVGWNRKRLWSRFRSRFGLSPKTAARLVRFDHAAHRLAAGCSAAVVAAETGYADQSHLHKDVVAFTGSTPSALAVSSFLAVDEIAWPTGAL